VLVATTLAVVIICTGLYNTIPNLHGLSLALRSSGAGYTSCASVAALSSRLSAIMDPGQFDFAALLRCGNGKVRRKREKVKSDTPR
jgi:hypothetical protein